MAVSLDMVHQVILSVTVLTVLLATLLITVVPAIVTVRGGGPGDLRGALLDAAILATGSAVTGWAASVALWPGQPVDTASLMRTALAVSVFGLALPAVLTPGSRARHLVPLALTGHAIAQAATLGAGPVPWWSVVSAVTSVGLGGIVVWLARGGQDRRRQGTATAAPLTHGLLLALSWIAAPTLLVGLQAAGVSVGARPLILGWVVMVVLSAVRLVDLSARVAAGRAERDAAQRFRGAFEHAQVAMALVATDGPARGTVTDVNDAMCRIYAAPAGDLTGRSIDTLVGAHRPVGAAAPGGRADVQRRTPGLFDTAWQDLTRSGRIQLASEMLLATTDGRVAWGVVSLAITHGTGAAQAVLQIEEVTERRAAREELDQLSTQDPLTGLANRRHLQYRLATSLARAERAATPVALVLVDLDRFATVNERHGTETGDEVLVEVGSRLRAVTRAGDTVARIGADHFAVLLGGSTGAGDATAAADRICGALVRPYHLRRAEVTLTAGVGMALAICAPHELLRDAQLALDHAKQSGSGRPVSYDDELRALARERATMTDDLRAALTGTGLRVVYQPVVSVPADGGSQRPVTGWEALLRWDRRTPAGIDQELLPADFLDVAEQAGLLVPIGYRVLEIALAALRVLPAAAAPAAGETAPGMAVNFSHRQLARGDAAARVLRAVETARVDASRLCIEIGETALAAGGDDLLATLRRLRQHGVTVALDDFGTGHTSLSQLRRLPIDIVKIDTSLVDALDRGADAQVVAGLVQLATALQLRVVAEGVETHVADRAVQSLGIPAAQGRLYGAPMPAPWPGTEPSFSPLIPPRRPVQTSPGVVTT